MRRDRVGAASAPEPSPAGVRPAYHPHRDQELRNSLQDLLALLCWMWEAVPAAGLPAVGGVPPLPEKLGDVRACGPPRQLPQHRGYPQGVLRVTYCPVPDPSLQVAACPLLRRDLQAAVGEDRGRTPRPRGRDG